MKTQIKTSIIISGLFFVFSNANADTCQSASASIKENGTEVKVTLMQHQFADGQVDLALNVIANNQSADIKRITYGGISNRNCRFLPIQVLQGGQWGLHLLWIESTGLYYARMDGEAWVSSPAKQIAAVDVSSAFIRMNGEVLMIEWTQSGQFWQRQSFNEGRSWEDAQHSTIVNHSFNFN